jgi:DNA polymerase III subunit gamma/tau
VASAVSRMTAPAVAPTQAPILASFEDVLALVSARRDIGLKLDLERFARPVSFRPGAIEFEPAPHTPNDLTRRLALRLKEWTGQTWLVATVGGGGAESAWEREKREHREGRAEIEADPFVRAVMDAFPGAEITEVRIAPPVVPADYVAEDEAQIAAEVEAEEGLENNNPTEAP